MNIWTNVLYIWGGDETMQLQLHRFWDSTGLKDSSWSFG